MGKQEYGRITCSMCTATDAVLTTAGRLDLKSTTFRVPNLKAGIPADCNVTHSNGSDGATSSRGLAQVSIRGGTRP